MKSSANINPLFLILVFAFLLKASVGINASETYDDSIVDLDLNQPLFNQNVSTNKQKVIFNTSDKQYSLILQPSNINQTKKSLTTNINNELSPLPILYAGYIEGEPTSWVRVSITANGMEGILFSDGKLMQLHNEQSHADENSSNSQPITRLSQPQFPGSAFDRVQYPPTTHVEHTTASNLTTLGHGDKATSLYHFDELNHFRNKLEANENESNTDIPRAVTRSMRVGIVVDSKFNEYHNGRGLAKALSIMNGVDGVFQAHLGLAVIVDSIRVFDDAATDPLRPHADTVANMLNTFQQFRQNDDQLDKNLALVHWFSGHRDPENVIGLGWIGTACRTDGLDISLSTPFPFDILLTAHEIGHNLGAVHDNDELCYGFNVQESNGLMWPRLSAQSTTNLSSCSAQHMQYAVNASCNFDNIDIAVSLQSSAASNDLERTVNINVSNKDTFRTAPSVTSVTTFPANTTLSNPSAGCDIVDETLNCTHNRIRPGRDSQTQVTATFSSSNAQSVEAAVTPIGFSDITYTDNRAQLNAMVADDATGSALSSSSQANQTASQSSALSSSTLSFSGNSGGSSGGLVNRLELLLLSLFFLTTRMVIIRR